MIVKNNLEETYMLKVVSFNIRCDYGQDGENNFEYRKPFIKEKLDLGLSR